MFAPLGQAEYKNIRATRDEMEQRRSHLEEGELGMRQHSCVTVVIVCHGSVAILSLKFVPLLCTIPLHGQKTLFGV